MRAGGGRRQGPDAGAPGVSKSSVSREFIDGSEEALKAMAERRFEALDLLVIYLDGLVFGAHHVLSAIGVDVEGHKHVLGLVERGSENAAAARDVVEGEAMKIRSKTGGVTEVQADGRWSGGRQLWWRDGKVGDRLELVLPVARKGKYRVVMHHTRANDYGIFQFYLDGEKLGEPVDLYSKENVVQLVALGTRELGAGDHVLAAEIVGANPAAAKAYMLGLDYLKLEPADASARPLPLPRSP